MAVARVSDDHLMMRRATAGLSGLRYGGAGRGRSSRIRKRRGRVSETQKEKRHAWMAHGAPCGCGVVTPPSRLDRTCVMPMPCRRAVAKTQGAGFLGL